VRDLGRLFGQRKANYQVQQLSRHEPVYHPPAEHIEVELRHLLMYHDVPQSLTDGDFEACQDTLETLCLLLEDLVSDDLAASSSTMPATSYPRLRGLLPFLSSAISPL
jgi:hypothetical protein